MYVKFDMMSETSESVVRTVEKATVELAPFPADESQQRTTRQASEARILSNGWVELDMTDGYEIYPPGQILVISGENR